VTIPPEIAPQAVVLSERYITDRFLPDKAIDLIDEACSDVNLRDKTSAASRALEKDRDDVKLELERIVETDEKTQEDYARLATLKSSELSSSGRSTSF
jgi:ATP-dependent Clp protease ATP-binding subunit ClpA